jgi:F-type H+-transporting ATPase subunit b
MRFLAHTSGPATSRPFFNKAKPMTEPVTTGTEVPTGTANKVFPPLDPTTLAPQLVWLTITFVALYFLLKKIAIPRIGGVIEERQNRIQRDIDAAEKLKDEVDAAMKSYEKSLADARSNATAIARTNHDKLTAETDRERSAVEAATNKKLADAEARITEMKQKALASVGEIASEIAGPVIKQLTGKDVSADEVKRALNPGAGE